VRLMGLAFLLPLFALGEARADPEQTLLAEIDQQVRKRFYSPEELERRGWARSVAEARAQLQKSSSETESERVFARLMASLKVSHTEYIPRTAPSYWILASTFEDMLKRLPDQCDPDYFPQRPVEWSSIGVLWEQRDGRWFIGGVFPGGPAQDAGLLLGDELVNAGGKPFHPIGSFNGKDNQFVELSVRRTKGAKAFRVQVKPVRVAPKVEFLNALKSSARLLPGTEVGYVRVWSWAGEEMQAALRGSISELNRQGMKALVLDIRGGVGGASPHYLSVFDTKVPALAFAPRGQPEIKADTQIRVPTIILIDGGARSGKEVFAFGAKRYGRAKLLGTRTAGAVMPGAPVCLSNGALLYVAANSLTVDGDVLEGKGIEPDVRVPFDLRYASGKDIQLERAVNLLRQ
jgi:carboxyl-terminal processing protease